LAPHLHQAPLWKNALVGVELTDETFALIAARLGGNGTADHAWLYGVNLTAQVSWVTATCAGALLGQTVSNMSAPGLDFALTAMLATPLVLQVAHQPRLWTAIGVAVIAALVAVSGKTGCSSRRPPASSPATQPRHRQRPEHTYYSISAAL
jgi:predicted branched-subunit amino acid permease